MYRRDYSAESKRYRDKIRVKILDLFGNKCNHCGITEPRVLQVDHIHRAQVPRTHLLRSGQPLWSAILDGRLDKNEFQLLCANCNWLKKIENKEHHPVYKTEK